MKSWKRLTAAALTVAVTLSGLGITGNVWRGKQALAQERTETVYEGDGYKVTYSVEGKWADGYNGSVTIANTGDRTIENWELAYKTKDEYEDVWNAETTYHIEGFYSIKNNKANADIEPGQEVRYGFKANYKDTVDFPEEFTLVGVDSEVPKENVEVTSEITEQWEKGATVNIHIKNISEEDIESWKLEFQVLGTVGNVWDAKLVSQEDGIVKLKSYGYNSYIHPGETETIGIQIQMDEATIFSEPVDFTVYEHKKEKMVLDFGKEWNRSMVRADAEVVKEAVEKNKYAINIGLIDSGVNYSEHINVVARKNFVEGYDELNPVFSDLSGHGTAVAGILASSSEEIEGEYKFDEIIPEDSELQDKIAGINPYVNLYSAGVLDDENKATVERVIKGIQWAIENDCKIIHISCGFDKDSEELHEVIKDAYDNGVLFVAPAGNEGPVKYPAKYPEVMAIGSLNCNAELAKDSSTGKGIEVVAPGENVAAYGFMDILENDSGTSMAAPQVTALAAMLWQQDLSKSNIYIRNVIDATANNLGNKEKYGYGLIDCKAAVESIKVSKNVGAVKPMSVESNDSPVLCVKKMVLEGFWSAENHKNMASGTNMSYGAIWPDCANSKIKKAGDHPDFHGYFKYEDKKIDGINYINSAIFLTHASAYMYQNNTLLSNASECDNLSKEAVEEGIKKATKSGFVQYEIKDKTSKAAFIFGMALHTVADSFAHSTYATCMENKEWKFDDDNIHRTYKLALDSWWKLGHEKNKYPNRADRADFIPNRLKSANRVCKEMIDTAWKNHKTVGMEVYLKMLHRRFSNPKSEKEKVLYLYGLFTMKNFETNLKKADKKLSATWKNPKGIYKELKNLCEDVDTENIEVYIDKWKQDAK